MKRPTDADARETAEPPNEQSKDLSIEESDIDQVLADSFPASDAPPWTFGVPSARATRMWTPQKR